MKLNIREEILSIKELYPNLAEKVEFICNENKRYELLKIIKELKNDIVRVQSYEIASYLRELEHQIFGDVFAEPLKILNGEVKLLLVDFTIESEFSFFCKLVEEDQGAMKQLWPDLVHVIFNILNGEFVITSTGTMTIIQGLNIPSISTFNQFKI